jgi:hypothetical protein
LGQHSLLHLSQLPPTVVALVADIPSLVALEWACLVAPEWGCGAVSTDMIISTITMIIFITMIMTMMSSLSVPSAFHRGGVGAGVRGGARAIRTDIMVMVTRTDTDTVMAMDMATTAMAMATAADPEWRSYSAGSLAPVIITDRLTAS